MKVLTASVLPYVLLQRTRTCYCAYLHRYLSHVDIDFKKRHTYKHKSYPYVNSFHRNSYFQILIQNICSSPWEGVVLLHLQHLPGAWANSAFSWCSKKTPPAARQSPTRSQWSSWRTSLHSLNCRTWPNFSASVTIPCEHHPAQLQVQHNLAITGHSGKLRNQDLGDFRSYSTFCVLLSFRPQIRLQT